MDQPHSKEKTNEESRSQALRAVFSFVIALALLIFGVLALIAFVLTKPAPEKKQEATLVPTVRVQPIEPGSHQVEIETQGVVGSVHEVALAAEVGGRVMLRAPGFIEGGSVAKGEVLVKIDPVNYIAAVARAESGVADAKLALVQEQAMAEQAAADWAQVGRGEPGDLVLRKPQIVAAEARIASAQAELARAVSDLERTTLRAPFDARVRLASVEVGAVVSPGMQVGELYAAGDLEVRLPIPLMDYGFLEAGAQPEFDLTAEIGGERKSWPAKLVRVVGEVDRATLSGYGIAQVLPADDGGLPPVGLFVAAVVPGNVLTDVVVLPRSAVRGIDEVWVVQGGRLAKRRVEVLRSSRDALVVRGDFVDGDQLVLTRLAAPLVGMKVEVDAGEVAEEP